MHSYSRRLPRSTRLRLRALLALLASALCAGPALALHRDSPGVIRFTGGTEHVHPSTRAWGGYFAFSSDADLLGNGSTGRQIYLFNLLFYDCTKDTIHNDEQRRLCPDPVPPYLVQVTNGPGDPDNPTVGTLTDQNGVENVRVGFDALGVFSGAPGAQASRRQIYIKDVTTGEVVQVTQGTDGDSTHPSFNVTGGTVVFQSTARLLGVPTPLGVSQIFWYQRGPNVLLQLTAGLGHSTRPITNKNGSLVAFQSTARLISDNANTGTSQIFLTKVNKTTYAQATYQITNGNGASTNPYLSEDSPTVIAFDSVATNLPTEWGAQGVPDPGVPGGGPGRKVLLADLDPANLRHFPVLKQLTAFVSHGDCSFPTISPDARFFPVICTGDPLQNGTTGNRLFSLNPSLAADGFPIRQITGTGDVQGPIAANFGNWFVTFASDNDLTGVGTCGHQLYMIDYFTGRWNAATLPGQVPPDIYAPPQSNKLGAHLFEFEAGNGGAGSQVTITTAGGTLPADLESGQLGVKIGAPDGVFQNADITVPTSSVILPPIRLPNNTALCLTPNVDGSGLIDCDGNATGNTIGANVVVTQDHNTDDTDPLCLAGCRENDLACQAGLPGAHGNVCNGPITSGGDAVFAAGDMKLNIPLNLALSTDPGVDGVFCAGGDDVIPVSGFPVVLRLTSNASAITVLDADNVPAATIAATDVGAPFSCNAIKAENLTGARLVGGFEVLDVPGIGDLVVSLDLVPRHSPLASGDCTGAPCTSSAECDDGNACNGRETCVENRCTGGQPVVCDDGNACNGQETCHPGTGDCLQGSPPTCDDNNPCTADSCPGTAGCVHAPLTNQPCDDNNACTNGDRCSSAGACVGTPKSCSDGNACNGLELCNPATGDCLAGVAPNCDDASLCTEDFCNPQTGCVHVPTVTAQNCNDGNACNGLEQCNPATGECQNGTPPNCDDGSLCTVDSCVPQTGCVNAPTPTAQSCNDGNACNGTETCNPLSGLCQGGTPVSCDDGNPCTTDTCNPTTGACSHSFNTVPCDDGNACTSNDVCSSGVCRGSNNTLPCDDANVCTSNDRCKEGVCKGTNNLNPCNDSNACTTGDSCSNGVCTGTPITCNDNNPCTDDACVPDQGCAFVPNSAPCNDGNACTTNDVCQNGFCGGSTEELDDGDACTSDTCDAVSGQPIHTPVADYLTCKLKELDAALLELARQVHGASALSMGGRPRQKRLEATVKRARKKLRAAMGAPRAKMRRQLTLCSRRMKVFVSLLDRISGSGLMDPATANELRARANGVIGSLSIVHANLI